MGWMGKIIGGSVGFILAGPLGALAGIALGSLYDAGKPSRRLNPGERSQFIFFLATFSMLAKMAKADGRVSRDEIKLIERFMAENLRLDREGRSYAIRIFNAARDSSDRFEDYAAQFYGIFRHRREIIMTMFELLYRLAAVDGRIDPGEEELLGDAARIFEITGGEYDRIKKAHGPAKDYYAVLGCSRNDSDAVIKKKYRRLIVDFHPDKIIAKGLPEEFVVFATERFREIQEAYEKILEERKRG